jgi:hypothetical protein
MKKVFYLGIFLFCGMSCLFAGDKSYYNWNVEVIGYKTIENNDGKEIIRIKKRKRIKVGGTREQVIADAGKRFITLYPTLNSYRKR